MVNYVSGLFTGHHLDLESVCAQLNINLSRYLVKYRISLAEAPLDRRIETLAEEIRAMGSASYRSLVERTYVDYMFSVGAVPLLTFTNIWENLINLQVPNQQPLAS